jgi:hypothetical protein
MDDFFAELEAEIAKSVKSDQLKKDRDALRKRANTMTLSAETRARAAEEYRQINAVLAAQEYQAIKTVALFTEQTCDGCGSVHRIFLQYMELQQLVRRPSTQQWVRVTAPKPEAVLPRETLLQPMTTHLCANCCEDHGFALLTANRLPSRKDTLVPSFTYEQADINAAEAA